MSVRNTVKSIQDILRQDVGVDGDAQRPRPATETAPGSANSLARGLIVVTSNLNEFQRVSGLNVENWR